MVPDWIWPNFELIQALVYKLYVIVTCKYERHSIISGLESWSGVLEWSGVKIGVDFGVDFGVKFGVEVGFFFC